MGKKYDDYAKAVQAETDAKARWQLDPTQENETNAAQAEAISNALFNEMLEDPEG